MPLTEIDYPNCAVKYISSDAVNSIEISPTNIIVDTNAGTANQILAKNESNELDWITPEPPVTIINYYISQTNPLFQYPPQPPSSTIINTYGYYGWQFINAVAGRKISWYFAPDYEMEVQDVLGLYMNYFNVASTSNDNLPFISIYTKPLGSGDIIPGFAHSSMTYIANFTPVVNSPYSSFMNITGVQPTPFAYGHQQVGMIQSPVNNPRGTYTPTMKVLAISVGTNSASAVNSVNFVMSKVGVCVAGLNNESVLNPFDSTQTSGWVSTATSNLDMSSYSINNVANLNAISATDMNINGQAVFDTPPHIPEPVLGNDAASKGYVDSLVGQYGGSLNLFLNYSIPNIPPVGYKQLSPVITTASYSQVDTITNGTEQIVASFITDQLNLDSLPAGVWVGNFNGKTADKNVAVSYVMRVYKYSTDTTETEIGSGATSTAINSLVVADYYCNLVVPTTPLALTDRLVVKLFVLKTGGGSNTTISSYFEGIYYSYVSSSLNAGTTLLSSNNVWSGTNDFQISGITSTIVDSGTTLRLGNGTATTTTLGRTTNTATNINGAMVGINGTNSVTITSPTIININGNLQIAGQSGSSGQILTSNGAGSIPTWTTSTSGWTGTATSNLNMSTYSIDASANNLSIGTLTSTGLTLGKSGNTTNIQGNLQIEGQSGTSGQYLTSAGAGAVPTWTTGSGGWIGTATSNLNMSSYNITSTSALSVGNTGVATRLIGDVDISNNLTYGNGTLRVYGATSVGTTAVTLNIGTAYPTRNLDFILILTGTTASQVLTFPVAVAGYRITIYNKTNKNWTMNCTGSDLFYGNGNDPTSGLATYRNGIAPGKCLTFFQQSLSYYLINESCSTTETYFGKLYANNNANAPINLLGNQEQLFPTTTPYTMPTFANCMISSFLFCTASASVINLQSGLITGYVIIIRNNTSLPMTIQGTTAINIYSTGSLTASPTYTLPSTMTVSFKVISPTGYLIYSLY